MPLQKSALPIVDEEISLFVNKVHKDASLTEILTSETLNNEFLDNYFNWLKSSELVQYKGIDEFDQKSYIHGSVQGFDFFYAEFSQRRFRCFKGDFVYHALSWRNNYSYIFLDDEDLDKNDAVVISLPFSDSGSIHPRTIEILKKCEELNIPVLIDGTQGAPHLQIDIQDIGCDFYVISCHKMYGPNGLGVLYAKKKMVR